MDLRNNNTLTNQDLCRLRSVPVANRDITLQLLPTLNYCWCLNIKVTEPHTHFAQIKMSIEQ